MKKLLLVLLAFIAGAVVTSAASAAAILTAWELLGIRDHDGGGTMGVFFTIAPALGLVGGIIAAVIVARRT